MGWGRMTATKPRTEWWDADDRIVRCPGEALTIFADGPYAGWRHITCRGDHPPLIVELPAKHGRRPAVYRRDDTAPKLTYRVVTA